MRPIRTPLLPPVVRRQRGLPALRRSGGLAVGACAVALVLAGCGSSKGYTTTAPSSSSTSAASSGAASGTPPVSLAGTVNDKGTKDVTGDGMAPHVSIEAGDNAFTPTFVKTVPGAVVTIDLHNAGSHNHTFNIDAAGIDQTLAPGQSAQVQVTIPASGSVDFYCQIHGGSGMQGAFFTASTAPSGGSDAGAAQPSSTTSTTKKATSGYGY